MDNSPGFVARRVAAPAAASIAFTLGCICLPGVLSAQRALDVQVGKWAVSGSDPAFYSAALSRDAWGPFGYGLRAFGLVDRDSLGASLYGLGPELTLLRDYRNDGGLAVYAVGGPGLVLRAGTSTDIAALWNLGLGVEFTAPAFFSARLEARRFVEDRGLAGFWDLGEADRRGWLVSAGFAITWGGPAVRPYGGEPVGAPSVSTAGTYSNLPAAPRDAGGPHLARSIVETALSAMGEPYRWGGTSTDEGFDCSGLVWYAYASHGVRVPRVSREQARSGRHVPAAVAALEPGDILLFSNRPGVVTHVGLYIGDAHFIHATTSGGVRIGALDASADANDRWYLDRWVGARRLLE